VPSGSNWPAEWPAMTRLGIARRASPFDHARLLTVEKRGAPFRNDGQRAGHRATFRPRTGPPLSPMLASQGASSGRQDRSGIQTAVVSLALPLEHPETREPAEFPDTVLAVVTRSTAVEWTRKAGACVTPFNLQR
jgi:hypothetical protein